MQNKNPRVGVGVMIFKDDKVLMGKRKGSCGSGEWAFPGGHLDHGESFEECAKRETLEECGLEIQNVVFGFVWNELNEHDQHYINIGMTAVWKRGEPELREPDKNFGWKWFDLKNLPQPIFEFCKHAIESYETGQVYIKNTE